MKHRVMVAVLVTGLVGLYALIRQEVHGAPFQAKGDTLSTMIEEYQKSGIPTPRMIDVLVDTAKKEKSMDLLNKAVDVITVYINYLREIPEHYRRLKQLNAGNVGSAELRYAAKLDSIIDRYEEMRADCRYEVVKLLLAQEKRREALQVLMISFKDQRLVNSREEKEIMSLLEVK